MGTKNSVAEKTIRKLVTRLLEFTEGCIVLYTGDIGAYAGGTFKFLGYRWEKLVFKDPTCHSEHFEIYLNKKDFEIIGHKIKLEDVLEAITIKIRPDSEEEGHNLNHSITTIVRGFWNIGWEYGKDFTGQSEETKQFISNLLK